MEKVLKESFEWTVVKTINDFGKEVLRAIIDPDLTSDDTFRVKDQLSKKYGMRWDPKEKVWYFTVWKDPQKRKEQIETQIKPCIAYLKSVEKIPSDRSVDEEVKALMEDLDAAINSDPTGDTPEETEEVKNIQAKLLNFKQELVKSFRDNTFREKMGPVIKFRQAQGGGFSILNSVLIMLQRPNAKMVKSIGNWAKANKKVKKGAKAIYLWCPVGKRQLTSDERLETEVKFYKKMEKLYGTKIVSRKQLKVGDREALEKELNKVKATGFRLRPRFFDFADVEQIQGKEDLIGNPQVMQDIEWFDDKTPVDSRSEELFDAVIATIKDFEVEVGFVGDLGGARGVSMGGKIEVLQDAPKNIGSISTLVHELSHELLHQTYLKTKGGEKEDFAQYFVGREYGKGIVEQQAEISAWIVLRNYGYDMQTAKNYVACWGGDEKTAVFAFDTVANVATRIIKGIDENLNTMNGLNEGIGGGTVITGLDVARLVGMENVYIKGEKEKTEDKIKAINEQFNSFLNRLNNVKF